MENRYSHLEDLRRTRAPAYEGAGPLGIGIGVLIFLGSFDSIAASDVYQGFLGWGNWLMPMSWLIVRLGLVFFVLNVLGRLFTAGQVDALRIEKIRGDWKTGTIFMEGGWISNEPAGSRPSTALPMWS